MTSSNRNISALVALCEENPPISGRFLSQRPITRSFDVFFDLRRQNKRLSKQLRRQWFKTSSRSLWSHCNVLSQTLTYRRFSSTAVDISACIMNYNLLFYENVTYSCRELVDLTSSQHMVKEAQYADLYNILSSQISSRSNANKNAEARIVFLQL